MRWVFLTLTLSLGGLAACQDTAGKTASRAMNDASVTAAVQRNITADRSANFTRVDVDTVEGIVRLSGVVHTPEQRTRAEELAKQVDGVRRVHNGLQIQTTAQQ